MARRFIWFAAGLLVAAVFVGRRLMAREVDSGVTVAGDEGDNSLDVVSEASIESFPASDPPSFSPGIASGVGGPDPTGRS